MKIKLIMKVLAVLIAVVTIYIVVVWEPSIKTDNNTNISDETMREIEDNSLVDNTSTVNNNISDSDINGVEEDIDEENLKNDVISGDVVITVDLKSVIEKLTLDDKTKINNILNKLSVTDYSRFINMLNGEGNSGGAVKGFELLKKRISAEDYKVIEELLGEYVDFSIIETKV